MKNRCYFEVFFKGCTFSKFPCFKFSWKSPWRNLVSRYVFEENLAKIRSVDLLLYILTFRYNFSQLHAKIRTGMLPKIFKNFFLLPWFYRTHHQIFVHFWWFLNEIEQFYYNTFLSNLQTLMLYYGIFFQDNLHIKSRRCAVGFLCIFSAHWMLRDIVLHV